MAQVFLSYARGDVGRAKSLALAIERAGYSVWWDRDLEGGAEYSLEIDEALKAADVVIVLWSKESVGSAWVRDEAAAGRDSGRLVPVRLDASEPPLGFRQYQTIDLSRWNGRSESAGVKTLKRAIATKSGRHQKAGTAGAEGMIAPPRTRRWPMRAFVAGLIALAMAGFGYFWFARQSGAGVPTVAIVTAPDAADRARSKAMARDLSVDVGSLRLATADAFNLREAAESSDGVDYLVRVSAAQQGGSPFAELTLLSRADPQILWSGNYRQADGNAVNLRQQVATRLAALLMCLGEAKPASGERLDDAAMKLYLRGCERVGEPVGAKAESELISLFRQVTERAPRFAPAWAYLAELEFNSETIGQGGRDPSIQRRGREYLERARQLDPDMAMVSLLDGGLLGYHEWEKRIEIFEAGLARHPDNAALHEALSIDLRQIGRMNDAAASALRAAELNPLSPRIYVAAIPILSATGRLEESRERLRTAERLWPGVSAVTDARYAFDLRYGDAANALEILLREPSRAASIIAATSVPNPAVELFIKARIDPTPVNKNAAVAAYLARTRKDPQSIDVASLVTLGETDLAYQLLQNPVSLESAANFTGVFFRKPLHEFRTDPRFMPLVARLGLVRYWLKTDKWPDFCLDEDLPYDCKVEARKYANVRTIQD